MQSKRIAIVYDWFDSWGGAERILVALHKLFPEAHFYTSYTNYKNTPWSKNLTIKNSFAQRIAVLTGFKKIILAPFLPFALESFDFKSYDIVISLTAYFAKSVITRPETIHIAYIFTPTRYLWQDTEVLLDNPLKKFAAKPLISHLKRWDLIVSNRPDYLMSISQTVADRVKKYYHRDSIVIFPPFDIDYWKGIRLRVTRHRTHTNPNYHLPITNYFLVVSRLEPYKKIELAIQAFNQLPDLQLVIVGNGTQKHKLVSQAGKNITFLQNVPDTELAGLYSNAQALIMPQKEDFGITALEAQFFGCPVISYRKGGSLETVIEDKTGLFFDHQNVDSLVSALEKYSNEGYNLLELTKKHGPENVEKFSQVRFEKEFVNYMRRYV